LRAFQKFIDSPDNFYKKFTPKNSFEDSVFDILTIYSSDRSQLEVSDFPQFAQPVDFKGRRDYWKLYAGIEDTYHEGRIDAYSHFGVDEDRGAIVILRPDGYVSAVEEFDTKSFENINAFFNGFMIEPMSINVKSVDVDDTDRFLQPILGQ